MLKFKIKYKKKLKNGLVFKICIGIYTYISIKNVVTIEL